LAKMLLPLYRSGELTMEEFNDFFKGLALKPKHPENGGDQGPSTPRPEDEAPSEILRSLSEDPGRKAPDEPKKPAAAPVEVKPAKPARPAEPVVFSQPSTSPEPPMASVESAIVEEIKAEELFEEGELEEEFLEEPDIEMEGALQPEADMKEIEGPVAAKVALEPPVIEHPSPPPAPQREVRTAVPVVEIPKPPMVEPVAADAETVQKALSTIIAKLASMEGLLARIEKNLRKP